MAEQSGLPPKFHPPDSYTFPTRKFGAKEENRTFQVNWCKKHNWLHYDRSRDAAFCHICLTAEHDKLFLASTKRDPAFITKGYTNWRDATKAFNKHLVSACHKEAVSALQLPKLTGDVGERLSSEREQQKAENRKIFRKILQNIRFLARQGLPLRGHGDGSDGNFIQLLHFEAHDCPAILGWIEKKTNKYISSDIQNEILQLMALTILRDISSSIIRSGFFTIMADECTDVANKEQFVVCIRWVDDSLVDHEDVIGVYNVGTIDATTLTSAIRDVLLRMGLKLSMCRGQCYDGASNMTGSKKGVASQLMAEESRALLTHCYGHALNLAVGDAIKQSKICHGALDVAFEVSRLIRFSPKRNAALDKIKAEYSAQEESQTHCGIRSFCPTRWTVRGDALESITENYSPLTTLWEECLETRLEPEVKGRIIGVQAQMMQFNTLYGLQLAKQILKITDNLSHSLQKQSMSAAEGQALAELTTRTLEGLRTEDSSDLFFKLVKSLHERVGTEPPALPRKRKAPSRYEIGSGEGFHSVTVEDYYRLQYYEALDATIFSIKNRFDQPGYKMYKNLESTLVGAANGQMFGEWLDSITTFYKDDFDRSVLSAQLQNLGTLFADSSFSKPISLGDCIKHLREFSPAQKCFFSEVYRLAQIILVMPATNAASERSFSAMRRLKTYLRSTMCQTRLNHIMLLNLNKDRVDKLEIDSVANQFVQGSEHCLRMFGKFTS